MLVVIALLGNAACGGGSSSSGSNGNVVQGLASPPPAGSINNYFGTDGHLWTSSINHSNNLITGRDITANQYPGNGAAAGSFTAVGGFLDITFSTLGTPPNLLGQRGGFALDIPGRAALLRFGDDTNPVLPLAPTAACPVINGTVTYGYLTIPNATWSNVTDTAYGNFQASVSNNNWSVSNIAQYTLAGSAPSNPGTGLPPAYCGLGTLGYVVTAPSSANNPPVATVSIGVGPSGFLVEDNGSAQGAPQGVVPSNAIGAGVGAIGIVQPSAQLNTTSVVAAQYLGFYYEPGASAVTQLASFGCTGSNCPVPGSSTAMIGGLFPKVNDPGNPNATEDDPTQPPSQDITIDFGAQDAVNNGLYKSATVTVSGVQFPAVALVGNPEGKFVVLLLAQDTLNGVPLSIYLFQR